MDLVRGTDLRTRLDRERRLAPEAAVGDRRRRRRRRSPPRTPPGSSTATSSPRTSCSTCRARSAPAARTRRCSPTSASPSSSTRPRRTRGHQDHRHAGLPGARDRRGPAAARRRRHLRAGHRAVRAARRLHARSAAATPARCCAAMSPRRSSRCPGIPDELWQLLVQCLAKAPGLPAARLRAGRPAAGAAAAAGRACRRWTWTSRTRTGGRRSRGRATEPVHAARRRPRGAARGAVPAGRRGAAPDSNRDTAHVACGCPAPGRAGRRARGARPARPARRARHGPARPATGRLRPAAADHAGRGGGALVAAVGVGTWLATSGDDADAHPQDTKNSAPAPREPGPRGARQALSPLLGPAAAASSTRRCRPDPRSSSAGAGCIRGHVRRSQDEAVRPMRGSGRRPAGRRPGGGGDGYSRAQVIERGSPGDEGRARP